MGNFDYESRRDDIFDQVMFNVTDYVPISDYIYVGIYAVTRAEYHFIVNDYQKPN